MANPVQTKVGSWNGGASTAATSFTSLPASGGAVIAAIRIYTGGSAGTVSSVTDNQTGNTYTKIKQLTDSSTNGDIELWWCSSITAPSGTFTVTAHLSGSFQARCDLIEGTSGLSLDQTGQNQATGTSGSVTASGANTSTTDFVIAAIAPSYDAGSSISGPSTGYTGFVSDTGFVTFVDTNIAYKTESSTVTSTATAWSWTNNQPYAAILATFKSSSGGNVTVALTGKSATFTAGTLTPNSSLALTGQQSIFTAGNLGGTDADALVGQKATFAAGTLTPNVTVALTGQAATFAAGTVVPSLSLSITGISATFTAGTLVPNTTIGLVGQSATFTAGTVSATGDVTVALSGQSAAFTAGTLLPSTSAALAGSSITSAAGQVIPAAQITLTGQSASYSSGQLSVSISIPLIGQSAVFAAGQLGIVGDVTVALTGQSATFTAGALVPALADDIGGDPPRRRKTRNVIKNGKFVQEKIPNWPFDQQAPQTEQIEVRTAPPTKTVQIATDEDIVHATISLMLEMM